MLRPYWLLGRSKTFDRTETGQFLGHPEVGIVELETEISSLQNHCSSQEDMLVPCGMQGPQKMPNKLQTRIEIDAH